MPRVFACPFWSWEKKLENKCEFCAIKFPSPEARAKYIKAYCTDVNGYRGCTVAQMSEEYYKSLR